MLTILINEENGMKDLYSLVCVHRWTDLGNDIKIAVNKFA
jgi:hypothetical protein